MCPPIYSHECKTCEKLVSVLRSIDEYLKPPTKPCPECGGTEWAKHVDTSTTRYYFCDGG